MTLDSRKPELRDLISVRSKAVLELLECLSLFVEALETTPWHRGAQALMAGDVAVDPWVFKQDKPRWSKRVDSEGEQCRRRLDDTSRLPADEIEVRWSALESLGRVGGGRVVEPLIAVVLEDWCDRSWAIKALERIGDARATESLHQVILDTSAYYDEHRSAANALWRISWRHEQKIRTR